MINIRSLTDLLTQNSDDKICKRWWLMTPNGTLLAHSSTASDIKSLRKQIAVVTLAWQEHDAARPEHDGDVPVAGRLQDRLRTLTIEADSNIIATRVQRQLLLVLEGGMPPRRPDFEPKTTAEGPEDEQYPPEDQLETHQSVDESASSSRASSLRSATATNILRLQRRKLEAMANAIADDFEQTGFQMPAEGTAKFF